MVVEDSAELRPDAPARRPARGATRQPRGRRCGDAARPRPTVAAHAPRPRRRRRGSRRRGRRPARRAQHRSRGRAAPPCTPTPRETCRPVSRRSLSRPGSTATRCTRRWQRGSTSSLHLVRDRSGARRWSSLSVAVRAGERTVGRRGAGPARRARGARAGVRPARRAARRPGCRCCRAESGGARRCWPSLRWWSRRRRRSSRSSRRSWRPPRWRPGQASARRAAELEWVESLVAELRAGADPVGALVVSAAAAPRPVVPRALAAARSGGDVAEALVDRRRLERAAARRRRVLGGGRGIGRRARRRARCRWPTRHGRPSA